MILIRAPLRITLGGGGTDLPSYYYQYGGTVLAAAIDKYVYIALHNPPLEDRILLKYSKSEAVSSPHEIQHDLVRAALLGRSPGGLEVACMADVGEGTGLGSSGAFSVALLNALYANIWQKDVTRVRPRWGAETAFNLEYGAGHPVGKQDHYMAAFGGVRRLDINLDGDVTVSDFCLPDGFREHVALFWTGLSRPATTLLKMQDDATKSGEAVDNLHRVRDLAWRVRDALSVGDFLQFGGLLNEQWRLKRERLPEATDPKINAWHELALANGALGGKLMGAGGGGFFMFVVPPEVRSTFRSTMEAAGLRELEYGFDTEGAKVLVRT